MYFELDVCVCVFKLEHLVEILLITGVLSKYLSFVSLPKLLLERARACLYLGFSLNFFFFIGQGDILMRSEPTCKNYDDIK